jgi:hypothetical protein
METIRSKLPEGGLIMKILFPIIILVLLYQLYNFLFGANGLEGKLVINNIRTARPDKGYIVISDNKTFPAFYQGGEVTLNGWIYINDYSINRGYNKHVFSLGGTGFLTLAIFLGPYTNTLNIRVHTRDESNNSTALSSVPGPSSTMDDLRDTNLPTIFRTLQQEGSLLNSSRPCDIQSIDLQKWIQITVTLNNKTCDVYMDGKLARSCILPSFFKVDKRNMAFRACEYGGFGGFISNASVYNYALNPEQIWRLYMAGPGPQLGIMDYVKSIFDPESMQTIDYPKQNIVG